MPAAHLPPQPTLAVEAPGHHEEEAAILVSRLPKATVTTEGPVLARGSKRVLVPVGADAIGNHGGD